MAPKVGKKRGDAKKLAVAVAAVVEEQDDSMENGVVSSTTNGSVNVSDVFDEPMLPVKPPASGRGRKKRKAPADVIEKVKMAAEEPSTSIPSAGEEVYSNGAQDTATVAEISSPTKKGKKTADPSADKKPRSSRGRKPKAVVEEVPLNTEELVETVTVKPNKKGGGRGATKNIMPVEQVPVATLKAKKGRPKAEPAKENGNARPLEENVEKRNSTPKKATKGKTTAASGKGKKKKDSSPDASTPVDEPQDLNEKTGLLTAPQKRGRKPATKSNVEEWLSENENQFEENAVDANLAASTEVEEPKDLNEKTVPKRRGRKPATKSNVEEWLSENENQVEEVAVEEKPPVKRGRAKAAATNTKKAKVEAELTAKVPKRQRSAKEKLEPELAAEIKAKPDESENIKTESSPVAETKRKERKNKKIKEVEEEQKEQQQQEPELEKGRDLVDGGNSSKEKKQRGRKRAVPSGEDHEPKAKEKKIPMNATSTTYNKADFELEKKEGEESGEARFNLKISSWNVAGLRSWLKKDGLAFLEYEQPDIFCLQETKCTEDQMPESAARIPGYHPYWLCKPGGYAGVAIYSKIMPINVEYGIGDPEHDVHGRIITAEYEKFYLVCIYVPNSGRKLVNLDSRMSWEVAFQKFIGNLDAKKPIVLCGDMNVSHQEIDLANPKTNLRSAGFTQEERDQMTKLLSLGYIDTFRHLYPDRKGAYTYWTYMANARSRNIGWRLDYFIVSERFANRVVDNCIRSQCLGSDHCPITLFLKM